MKQIRGHHSFLMIRIGSIRGFIWCMYVQAHIIHMLIVPINTDTQLTLLHIFYTFGWRTYGWASSSSLRICGRQWRPRFPAPRTRCFRSAVPTLCSLIYYHTTYIRNINILNTCPTQIFLSLDQGIKIYENLSSLSPLTSSIYLYPFPQHNFPSGSLSHLDH